MGKYFGTDGFRGKAGEELCAEHAFKIGKYLGKESSGGKILVVKDTRLSSGMLECALSAGATSMGADVYLLGVNTTPCASYLTYTCDFNYGVMISASHNPYYDNGIKILSHTGEKLSDEETDKIEQFLDAKTDTSPTKKAKSIGKAVEFSEGAKKYVDYLVACNERELNGLRVGLDTANGSACLVAREAFERLGASVYTIADKPNGVNINDGCGSTNIDTLVRFVKESKLDIGFAYDGDADRCLAVDGTGMVVSGDGILYVLGNNLKEQGALNKNTVVTTVMSNSGTWESFQGKGIEVKKTQVGDRFVYEEMKRGGYSLGGEDSGHIIISKYARTGDGILTSIKISELAHKNGGKIASLLDGFSTFPSIQGAVLVGNKEKTIENPRIWEMVDYYEKVLGSGRILVRASGTEPKIRVLVEGKSTTLCREICAELQNLISECDSKY